MRPKEIVIILRKDGYFHYKGRKIKAVRPGNGYGVLVALEPSPIDKDFEAYVWFPSVEELSQIMRALDSSDELTYKLLGRGWDGKRPFRKLHEFM